MANWLTRVPSTPPPVDELQRRLLPVADGVMALMWSRPGGLSLRNTWVTSGTIWLCIVVSLPAAMLGLGAIGRGIASNHPLDLLAGILGLCLATGVGAVALFGIRQRLLARRVQQ